MKPSRSILAAATLAAAILAAGCAESATSSPATSGSAATGPASTGTASTGPASSVADGDIQQLTFTAADGTKIDYVLLVPPGRTVGQPGKVVFTFPPGGQDLDVTRSVVESRWHDEALSRGWVVVSPAAPSTGLFYDDESARLVPELLDAIAADYPPEGGRFDLAGVSNGGLSAFKAALSYPERFRSLVVFPGYSPDGGDDPNLSKLKDIGVSMFVGGDDTGWLDPSRQTQQTLESLGYTVELHVVAGEPHIIASLTGKDLFDAIERVRG
jgi:dipeptidyl aminopeptidase/acylaminoacyl peptidase